MNEPHSGIYEVRTSLVLKPSARVRGKQDRRRAAENAWEFTTSIFRRLTSAHEGAVRTSSYRGKARSAFPHSNKKCEANKQTACRAAKRVRTSLVLKPSARVRGKQDRRRAAENAWEFTTSIFRRLTSAHEGAVRTSSYRGKARSAFPHLK